MSERFRLGAARVVAAALRLGPSSDQKIAPDPAAENGSLALPGFQPAAPTEPVGISHLRRAEIRTAPEGEPDIDAPVAQGSAVPMTESLLLTPEPEPHSMGPGPDVPAIAKAGGEAVPSGQYENLSFKVSPAFRKRFKACAFHADLKLNELLVQALDAWEKANRV